MMQSKLMFARRLTLFVLVCCLLVGTLSPATAEPIVVRWFVGLGVGTSASQIEAQEAVVEAFNNSQDEILLEIAIYDNSEAVDVLHQLIVDGNAPDIIGPVGFNSANDFNRQYLDLEPLAIASGYDLAQYPQEVLNAHRESGQGLVGLPLIAHPSFIYYRPSLLEAAGLPPSLPTYAGALYDGELWTMGKLREIGMLLTLDGTGKNATEPEFDSETIQQWGFVSQFNDLRGYASLFGAEHPFDAQGNAMLPDSYTNGLAWFYEGIWSSHFIPTESQKQNLNDNNAFETGQVAMAHAHMWYTCCAGTPDWNIAIVPSYNGVYTAKLHTESFRILKYSKNPEAAFEALTYLLDTASTDLQLAYGGMPVLPEDYPDYITAINEQFPQGVNWQVAIDSLNYVDIPNHESFMPNYPATTQVLEDFRVYMESTPGLNMPEELDMMIATLNLAGSHRLLNGDFEIGIRFWKQKNPVKDKVKCNKPEKDKIVSFTGDCAFMFKGATGANSKLQQDAETVYVIAGKELTLSGMVKAKGAVNSNIKVVISYENTALPKGKIKAKLTASNEYAPLTGDLSLLLPDNVESIKVKIANKSASGKIFLDNLRLQALTPAPLSLPLLGLPEIPLDNQ